MHCNIICVCWSFGLSTIDYSYTFGVYLQVQKQCLQILVTSQLFLLRYVFNGEKWCLLYDLWNWIANSSYSAGLYLTFAYKVNIPLFVLHIKWSYLIYLLLQLTFTCVIYPCLVVQYMGQAAFLSKNTSSIDHSFYDSIPG